MKFPLKLLDGSAPTREVGMDLAEWKVRRVMVVTDPLLRRLPPVYSAKAIEIEDLEARITELECAAESTKQT
jgi:hypothetical protein